MIMCTLVNILRFFLLPQKLEQNTFLLHFVFQYKNSSYGTKNFPSKNIPILLHSQHFLEFETLQN